MAKRTKPSYDSGDEGQVKARKSKLDLTRETELEDLRAVLAMPQGRRVFWRLWDAARIFQCTFTPGDPHQSAFNEGHRNLGRLFLMDVMEACPERFAQAQAEANAKNMKEEEADA